MDSGLWVMQRFDTASRGVALPSPGFAMVETSSTTSSPMRAAVTAAK